MQSWAGGREERERKGVPGQGSGGHGVVACFSPDGQPTLLTNWQPV